MRIERYESAALLAEELARARYIGGCTMHARLAEGGRSIAISLLREGAEIGCLLSTPSIGELAMSILLSLAPWIERMRKAATPDEALRACMARAVRN